MLFKIAGFEIRYQITSPAFIAIFAIFFLLAFGNSASDFVQIGSSATVNVNSPSAITLIILIMSIFGMIIPTVFLVSGVIRDFGLNTAGMIFTTQVKEHDYLIGRFIGGLVITLLAFASIPLGTAVGAAMPWVDQENLGPFVFSYYAYPFFVFGALNMLVIGLIMFTVGNLTRSNIATYVTFAALFVLYLVGNTLLNQPEWREIVAIGDPFGISAYGEVTRYWTPAEQNTRVVPLEGTLLINRLLWLGIAAGLFVVNLFAFSFRARGRVLGGRRRSAANEAPFVPQEITLPRAEPGQGAGVSLTQFLARIGFEIKGVVFNVAFWILLGIGIFLAAMGLLFAQTVYGTPNYPVTRTTIDVIVGGFSWVPVVVIVYYASEVIWRERNHRFSDIVDATPTPSWVFVSTKLIALTAVVFALLIAAMLTGMVIQLAKGYTNLELGQYAERLVFGFGIPFAMTAVLAIFFQIVFNNRWLGMLALIVFSIAQAVAANFGFNHNLYLFGGAPGAPYSDMNGYGHFLGILAWFYLYWGAISVLLIVLSYLLWNRGALTPIWRRLRQLPSGFSGGTAALASVALLIAIGSGSWIFYNTNILNEYSNNRMAERQAAEFERAYRADLENLPQPKITDVSIDVDIYPDDRRYEARGTYVIENKTDAAIDTVWLTYGPGADIAMQEVEGASLTTDDTDFRMYGWTFDTPLQPGATAEVSFEVAVNNRGFRNGGNVSTVNYNGTFFNNGEAMPSIGFQRGRLLQDPQARRRQGLEEIERTFDLEDEDHWYEHYIGSDADFVTFRTTVSTAADQIAVAPGYLEREWTEGDRRYFEYVMDAPILNFYSWLSAEYAVFEEEHNGINFQIFYHPPHDWNLERMMEAAQESIDYFSEAFSPYQYRQFRIMEFPAYASFAQAFPNTIPYSEGIGFIADLRGDEEIDYVYYVTAHEAAHQWWAHQVMSANVQGGTMLIETFAQYGALMVMEREYGADHMRRFLKYELDNYLNARSNETREELPLYRVENQQHIHYRKGAVIMYALQDYVGEDVVNRAMQRLIEGFGFQGDPYARSADFLRILREEAGPEWDDLITDFFERITIFDLQVESAETREIAEGEWETTVRVEARKFYADGQGEETEAEIDYGIDIGLFRRSLDGAFEGTDHILHFERRQVNESEMEFVIRTTGERPIYAGIDPYNKLIDRNSDDNLARVEWIRGEGGDESGGGEEAASD